MDIASYEERSDPESYEWKELSKTIPLFEDRGPELRTMDNKMTGED
jgi:hypothetical protein